ncbi:HAD-IIA family hydrolase [Aggregatilineales bacterium SYSU G02658]
MNLREIKAAVFDMDGVLWRGNEALPGLAELFQFLHARAIPYRLATNNSRRTPAEYAAKLAKLGVPNVPESNILTSGIVTAAYLQTRYPAGTGLYVIGGPGLKQELTQAGFVLRDEDVRAVVVGIDLEFTYAKARHATRLIRSGADFIASNPDRTVPLEDGLAPGAGSIVAMLQAATDCAPTVLGKPHPPMFETALRQMNVLPHEAVMVGDRLNTDIEGAKRVGMKAVLALTGVNTREDAASAPYPPDLIVEDLHDLLRRWA